MKEVDDPVFLSEQVYASEAYRIRARLETLAVNFFVFERNYHELKKVIEASRHPNNILRLWDVNNRHELRILMNEVIRLLHNFLASAKTLVDHTRALISDWYENTDFLREYNSEVDNRFSNNPVSGFIEGLRNYALHYSLPLTNAKLSVKMKALGQEESVKSDFVLVKSVLLHWPKWPQKAKTFLNSAGDEIAVDTLIDNYFRQIAEFHSWMHKRLLEIHETELAWLTEMNKRIQEALEKHTSSEPKQQE